MVALDAVVACTKHAMHEWRYLQRCCHINLGFLGRNMHLFVLTSIHILLP